MFYDDLPNSGNGWNMENSGPVWHPSGVAEDWRPYTDGRWVPTTDGNVFEIPGTVGLGHLPLRQLDAHRSNGWVWVPGRTWYPSTVDWRTSPESEPVETSYVGWAPTPPPNYEPPPMYAPSSYYQGAPVTDSLSSPLWIFVRARQLPAGLRAAV